LSFSWQYLKMLKVLGLAPTRFEISSVRAFQSASSGLESLPCGYGFGPQQSWKELSRAVVLSRCTAGSTLAQLSRWPCSLTI